jgi:hypothetical protein
MGHAAPLAAKQQHGSMAQHWSMAAMASVAAKAKLCLHLFCNQIMGPVR